MPTPLFRSVLRPSLDPMGIEDVEVCERCDGEGVCEALVPAWGLDHHAVCPDCWGYRLVHGYSGGMGLPVAPTWSVEGRRAPASVEANDDSLALPPLPLVSGAAR